MSRRPQPVARREPAFARLAQHLRRSRVQATTHLRKQALFYTLALAGLLVFCFGIWPIARSHLQAIAILDLVSSKPVPWLVGEFVAEPITVHDVTLHVESGDIRARIYAPELHPDAPALVIFHGVHHLGIDEPRLTEFAAAMASCGIRVLTPELPDIKDYHLGAASVRTIGESAQWFAHQTAGPVGVMGLSFSGGLALIAAADPLYHPAVKFVFAVGAQDSMARVVQYYRTGADARPNGSTQLLPAHEYGPLVIEYEYVQDFVPAPDVAPIRELLRAHLYEDKAAEDAARARLTEPQRAQALQLMDADSPNTRTLIAAASARHLRDLDDLSPHGRLAHLTTPVYLLHGEADNIIPSAETLWMAAELPHESLQAMLISPVISHIDFEHTQPGALDTWRLVHFFALVMHAVDTPDGRKPWL
jgi:pimeloyl-ACP methyl ester carboxylesterase